MTSSRPKPVERSHASLKSRMRPPLSSTQTSACVVSVRTLAKSSPRTNPLLMSDVENRRFVALDGEALGAGRLGRELRELLAGLGARVEGFLVRPQRHDERLPGLAVEQADQTAVAGCV